MDHSSAHQNSWETSEAVFGIPLLVSLLLSFLTPLTIAAGLIRWVLLLLGALFFVLGIYLVSAARRQLSRFGQPTGPGRPTTGIVTSGVFSISRNPLYLGAVLLIAGLGLAINSWWVLILLVLEIMLCHIVLIIPEERYLANKFGDAYWAYAHTVRRWLGRK